MHENKKPKVRARKILFESKKFRVVEKDMEFEDTQTVYALLLLKKYLNGNK